jgi:hypothetical protein
VLLRRHRISLRKGSPRRVGFSASSRNSARCPEVSALESSQ